jgi:hypothetical protein
MEKAAALDGMEISSMTRAQFEKLWQLQKLKKL